MAIRRKNNKKKQDETLVDLGEASGQVKSFYEENQNLILGGLLLLVVLVGGIYAYQNLYKAPRQKEAVQYMAEAEKRFEQDSFSLALQAPGNGGLGFLDIIDTYSGTKAANISNYYAGICWLNLGKYEAAISHLQDFSASGSVTPIMKWGAIGDAYSELGKMDEAESNYKKAVNADDNEFLTAYYLFKLGLLHENNGNYSESLAAFKKIKDKYPNSPDGREIEKYITRVSSRL